MKNQIKKIENNDNKNNNKKDEFIFEMKNNLLFAIKISKIYLRTNSYFSWRIVI